MYHHVIMGQSHVIIVYNYSYTPKNVSYQGNYACYELNIYYGSILPKHVFEKATIFIICYAIFNICCTKYVSQVHFVALSGTLGLLSYVMHPKLERLCTYQSKNLCLIVSAYAQSSKNLDFLPCSVLMIQNLTNCKLS